jgi:branched-chain amino acid transport system permease protein
MTTPTPTPVKTPPASPAPTPRPLERLGTAWDRVVERYNRQPASIKLLLMLLLVLFFYALPLLRPPIFTTNQIDFGGVMFSVAAFALVALGLNIVIGYAGLLDLGYVGFYATGAYTTGVLTSYHWHWPFFLALPVAIAVTMLTGVILGAPTLRVRGDYLAIVTLGFGEIIRICAQNIEWLGASAGIKDIPHPNNIGPAPQPPFDRGGFFDIPRIQWEGLVPHLDHEHATAFMTFTAVDAIPYYWVILTALILVFLGDRLIKASRVGRAWEATREDEDAAELMGVPTFRYKLMAFALGAAIGGLSGSLYASGQGGYISPDSFPLLLSMLFVAAVIVGGSGNRWGAIAGGALVAYLPERFRGFSDYRLLVFGLALTILAVWRPEGLLPPRRTRRIKKVEATIDALEEGDVEEAPRV